MKTIIEPFRIKMVEPIHKLSPEERKKALNRSFYNLFNLKAEEVIIDLLTDSGTGAMSSQQWGVLIQGDESYAGSSSFFRFEKAFQDLTGIQYIIPTHQGRAAEKILFSVATSPGQIIPSNTHFDTTRANINYVKAIPVDLLTPEAYDFDSNFPFKGNMDPDKLQKLISKEGKSKIPLVMITVTNNAWGGQPVSLENLKMISSICKSHQIPFFMDACRFAENAFFIKLREPGQAHKTPKQIAQEMFSFVDGFTFSAKKDAIANIGGALGINNPEWTQKARELLILTEGFPTYGGLAGRDLEAIAQGLEEVLDEDYLQYRIVSTAYVGKHLMEQGVPILRPVGGHAVFLNASKFVPHISPQEFPAQALACELYIQGGIRGVEIGTLMFGSTDPKTKKQVTAQQELVRLAIPRRTYTQSHMDYVIEVIGEVFKNRDKIKGLKILEEAPSLRHFTAKLAPVPS